MSDTTISPLGLGPPPLPDAGRPLGVPAGVLATEAGLLCACSSTSPSQGSNTDSALDPNVWIGGRTAGAGRGGGGVNGGGCGRGGRPGVAASTGMKASGPAPAAVPPEVSGCVTDEADRGRTTTGGPSCRWWVARVCAGLGIPRVLEVVVGGWIDAAHCLDEGLVGIGVFISNDVRDYCSTSNLAPPQR